MSLINDALKRAKAAQDKEPGASPPLQFRPVEPGQQAPNKFPWSLVIILAVLLVGGYFLFKLVASKETALEVEAKAANAPALQPTNVLTAPSTTLEPPTQQLAVATSAPAPKLQSLFFNPTRPSAVISGHIVFVGDKLGNFRVAAITRSSATLVSATETNILTFGE